MHPICKTTRVKILPQEYSSLKCQFQKLLSAEVKTIRVREQQNDPNHFKLPIDTHAIPIDKHVMPKYTFLTQVVAFSLVL